MFNILEIIIVAIAIAWLVLLADIVVFYTNILKEQREIDQVKEKINHTEESIEKIKDLFATVKKL